MIKNYFTAALRNIKKYKGYSLINIVSLAIGMSACILIWHFVSCEKSFDDFHENGKEIIRLELAAYKDGKLNRYMSQVPGALMKVLSL